MEVDLLYQPDRVELTVSNNATDNVVAASSGAHRGLRGIRERVALYGGDVTYGSGADGTSWQTRVRVPVEAS
ncbi:hypothetical protein SAMN05216174_101490 [Actinokineospora iranica]|uniref:Histidine kinase n=1 Tax=Actinokineospora iranica TaxID=1271860 RepID=A0A1G6JNL5_9PSEU|nr:hypothetical protein SAMN05216174_101490 [Actinokineospora iranica]